MLRDGFFIAISLANNEYGLVFVIPESLCRKGFNYTELNAEPIPTFPKGFPFNNLLNKEKSCSS